MRLLLLTFRVMMNLQTFDYSPSDYLTPSLKKVSASIASTPTNGDCDVSLSISSGGQGLRDKDENVTKMYFYMSCFDIRI